MAHAVSTETRFRAVSLDRQRLPQAYPLVQSVNGAVSLERWLEFAEHLLAVPDGEAGVIAVERATGYLHGVFTYEVRDDLEFQRALWVANFCAQDLLYPDHVVDTLITAIGDLSRRTSCAAVHVEVAESVALHRDGDTTVSRLLCDTGHAIDAVRFCKPVLHVV